MDQVQTISARQGQPPFKLSTIDLRRSIGEQRFQIIQPVMGDSEFSETDQDQLVRFQSQRKRKGGWDELAQQHPQHTSFEWRLHYQQHKPHYDHLISTFRAFGDQCHRSVKRFKASMEETCTHTGLAAAACPSSFLANSGTETIAAPPLDASKKRKMDVGGEDQVPAFRSICQQTNTARSATHLPTKKFRILYVPDKRYMEPPANIRNALPTHWITTTIPQNVWQELSSNPGTQGYVYLTEVGKFPVRSNTVTVHIDEWLFIIGVAWRDWFSLVDIKGWDQMKKQLTEDTIAFTNAMAATYDCVIAFTEFFDLDSDIYGWCDAHAKEQYIQDVRYFSSRVLCWPRVPELLESGRKSDLIRKLDHISLITETNRPQTIQLRHRQRPPKGYLIKRDQSAWSKHVFFGQDALTAKRSPAYTWVAQEFVSSLREWGELRVICVAGQPLYTVLTTPTKDQGQWEWSLYERPYSLAALSDAVRHNSVITPDQIGETPDADPRMAREALKELDAFVKKTLDALVDMELRRTGNSSLTQFCRLDLGLIVTKEGNVEYFVNEVEWGTNVCLWAGSRLPHLVGDVAENLGPTVCSWIEENATAVNYSVRGAY